MKRIILIVSIIFTILFNISCRNHSIEISEYDQNQLDADNSDLVDEIKQNEDEDEVELVSVEKEEKIILDNLCTLALQYIENAENDEEFEKKLHDSNIIIDKWGIRFTKDYEGKVLYDIGIGEKIDYVLKQLGQPTLRDTREGLIMYNYESLNLLFYGTEEVKEIAIVKSNRLSNREVFDAHMNKIKLEGILQNSTSIAENGEIKAVISFDDLWNQITLYIIGPIDEIKQVYTSETLDNLLWIDSKHLLFSKYGNPFIYDIDTDQVDKVQFVDAGDCYNYGIKEILEKGENFLIFRTDEGIVLKIFYIYKNDGIEFTTTNPENQKGSYYNDVKDVCFSNMHAGAIAASDEHYIYYNYVSYGDLAHPGLRVEEYNNQYNDNEQIQNNIYYMDEEEYASYIQVNGDNIYYRSDWVSITINEDNPDNYLDWIFYPETGLICTNRDGSNRQLLYEGEVRYVNTVDEMVYFLDENGKIISIDKQGEIREVYRGRCSTLYVENTIAYFNEDDKLYKMNLDNKSIECIISTYCRYPVIIDKVVYYINKNGDLVKYDTFSHDYIQIIASVKFFSVYGDIIYYINQGDDGTIRLLGLHSMIERIIYEGVHVEKLTVVGDYIFFSDSFREGYMSIRNDGTEYTTYCAY